MTTTSIQSNANDSALLYDGNPSVKFDASGITQGYSNFSIGRNLIVNGSCQVDQVNNGALQNPVVTASYPADNIQFASTLAGKLSAQQITTSLNSLGVSHALRFTVVSQFTPAATDYSVAQIGVEGLNLAHLQWGTADAAPVSLQFKARASVAGTYSGAIRNASGTRSYPFTFTLAANTDTQIKIENIPGETSGTWPTSNTNSLWVHFDFGTGNNFRSGAGTWQAGNYMGATGATNLVSQVTSSTLDISDVQLEKGSFCTTFERKLYDQVLRECQRYLPAFDGGGGIVAMGDIYNATLVTFRLLHTTPTRVPVTGFTSTALNTFTIYLGGASTNPISMGVGLVGNHLLTDMASSFTSGTLGVVEAGYAIRLVGGKIYLTGARL